MPTTRAVARETAAKLDLRRCFMCLSGRLDGGSWQVEGRTRNGRGALSDNFKSFLIQRKAR